MIIPGFGKRFGSFLSRATSLQDSEFKRHRGYKPSASENVHHNGNKRPVDALPQVTEGYVDDRSLESEKSSRGHQRGVSLGVNALIPKQNQERKRNLSVGDSKRPSSTTSVGDTRSSPRASNIEGIKEEDEGLTEQRTKKESDETNKREPKEEVEQSKPLFLKGMFSVATTTTKPISRIRSDLKAVVDRAGIRWKEINGGFECIHAPSIDLVAVTGKGFESFEDSGPQLKTRTPILKRKSSRPESPSRRSKGKDKDKISHLSQSSLSRSMTDHQQLPDRAMTPSTLSFISSTKDGVSRPNLKELATPQSPRGSKTIQLPPNSQNDSTTPRQPLANADDLVVRFEIFVIKIGLLPGIHGLQFHRISGNSFQYQRLARRILQELKL